MFLTHLILEWAAAVVGVCMAIIGVCMAIGGVALLFVFLGNLFFR